MGLLDEAIREHLELKRRRGADPGEIAHEEQAALEPVFADEEPAEQGDDAEASGAAGIAESGEPWPEPAAGGGGSDDSVAAAEPSRDEGAHLGQETAELDMLAVLDADGDADAGMKDRPDRDSTYDAVASPHTSAPGPEHDSGDFEWEVPGDASGESLPEQTPGQERMSFE